MTFKLREAYLSFFESKGHTRIPSAPLIPEHDPTTLFTGSGMQPLLPFLLGQAHPQGQRLVNAQKCFRSGDLDEVGDNRHTTFFEMLGNWSLGNYFKEEQIPWIFSLLTQEIGLDPARLYVTVFRGNDDLGIPRDTTSATLWQHLFNQEGIDAAIVDGAEKRGLQGGRIFYYDETKNWWSRSGVPATMPVGEPGGPDSEMFWDFGASRQPHENSPFKDQPCHVNCDCGRFMEIGNSVFMEYQKTATAFSPLAQKNVDFGGGLERLAAAVQDDPDIFMIDLFTPARQALAALSGATYHKTPEATKAFRVILDHVRAATFLMADGATPSNKDQGYFVRRLIRRSVRFAQQLGINRPFGAVVADKIIETYQATYTQLPRAQQQIQSELTREEEKFRRTLSQGLRLLKGVLARDHEVSPQLVFDLYQSYGFPLEMTEEIAREEGVAVDRDRFQTALRKHQELSRSTATQKFKGGLKDHTEKSVHYHTATHLLHQALRTVLGDHVLQRGSNITPDRLRFDFSHPTKLSAAEIAQVEDLINQQIAADLPVERQEVTVAEAKALGALGLFEHKYARTVSVYSIGDFSREICGGPHVKHTSVLGKFKIAKEESAGAGIRRVKATLGPK